jgi:hypothetical protein
MADKIALEQIFLRGCSVSHADYHATIAPSSSNIRPPNMRDVRDQGAHYHLLDL